MIFFKNFQQHLNIIHGILERNDGSVNPFSNNQSAANVLKAVRLCGFIAAEVDNLIFAEQVHSHRLHFCSSDGAGYIKLNVDGLVSEAPGQVLVIKTADCLPILFYQPSLKRVAAVHAGREGLIEGIIEGAIRFFPNPKELLVGIGPYIGSCCYYLRGESKRYGNMPEWKKYSRLAKDGNIYFNLAGIAEDKLKKAGVAKYNIENMGICTHCHARQFFSARKRDECPDFYQRESEKLPCFGTFIALQ